MFSTHKSQTGKTMSYIPDFLQPVFITLVEMFWKEDTSHPAWIGFNFDRLRSMSSSSTVFPFVRFLSISSAYHDWNEFLTDCLNVSFPARSSGCNSPVQEAGINRTLISFSDSFWINDSHWWALKTSNIQRACASDFLTASSHVFLQCMELKFYRYIQAW